MRNPSLQAALLSVVALSFGVFSGCVDEKVVFQDRDLFQDPPDAAASFLGYSDHDAKLTVCGNCHIGPQSDWEKTAHAGAWATLQGSGGAQAFCEGCHTVSELGNATTGDVGYTATGDARYEDVQCESCHGPGLTHVTNPTDETVPLAPLDVGVDNTLGCGECHNGSHHPMVNEWAQSRHGRVNAYPAGRAECQACHTGEGALEAWGVQTRYLEQEAVARPGEHLAITCAVCHDPHGSDNEKQLRFPVDVPNVESNLCMKCHQKRGTPDPGNFRGPHSPEGPTLLGVAGWWPPSLEFPGDRIAATHGSEANPKLCAGCHVSNFTVTDATTGEFVFQVTGHTFEAIPCLDDQGIPVGGATCDDSQRTFRTCVNSGCHASEDVARSVMFTSENRIDALLEELDALIRQVPSSEFNETDSRYTVGEGAKFNSGLGHTKGTVVHNPLLIEALLTASIKEVKKAYGLKAVTGVSLDRILGID